MLWLTVHATWGFYLVVLLCSVLGWWVGHKAVRLRRNRSLLAQREFDQAIASLKDAPQGALVTLQARLEVRGKQSPRLGSLGDCAASSAYAVRPWSAALHSSDLLAQVGAEKLVLVLGNDTIEVCAPVEVRRGSQEKFLLRGFWGLPPILREQIRARGITLGLRDQGLAVLELQPGDSVLARGRLRKTARHADAAGYREEAVTWQLTSPEDDSNARVLLAKATGPSRLYAPAQPLLFSVLALLLSSLSLFVSTTQASKALGASCRSEAGVLHLSPKAVFASLNPKHHSSVLRGLFWECASEAKLPQPSALDTLVSLDPERSVGFLLEHNQPERAAQLAETLGLQRDAASAWFVAGEVARSSDALLNVDKYGSRSDLDFALYVHLLNGRLDRALPIASELAACLKNKPGDDRCKFAVPWAAPALSCLVEALRVRLGTLSTPPLLQTDSQIKASNGACLVLGLDSMQPDQRAQALRNSRTVFVYASDLRTLLAAETGEVETPEGLLQVAQLSASGTAGTAWRGVGLVLTALRSTATDSLASRLVKVGLNLRLGAFERLTGNSAEARRLAQEALAELETLLPQLRRTPTLEDPVPLHRYGFEFAGLWSGALSLLATLELDAGNTTQAEAFAARLREPPGDLRPSAQATEMLQAEIALQKTGQRLSYAIDALDNDLPALVSAVAGDGNPLYERLLKFPRSARWIALVAPKVKEGRGNLVQWLQRGDDGNNTAATGRALERYHTRLLIAEGLGDAQSAATQRGRLKRLREGFLRRDTAVLLGILDSL